MNLNAIKWSKREKILVSTVIVFLLFAHFKYIHSSLSAKNNKIVEQKNAVQAQINSNSQNLAQLMSRNPASISRTSESGHYKKYLNANDNFSNIVKQLIEHDQKSKFYVRKMGVAEQNEYKGYTKTLFNLEVEGSFFSIGDFLQSLESSALLTEVKEIKIDRISDDLRKCSAKIDLYSYVARSEQ